MPILKSAIKKNRQDKKRHLINRNFKESVKKAIKIARKDKKPELIKKAQGLLDHATKNHLFHKNKVAHLKSQLMSAS